MDSVIMQMLEYFGIAEIPTSFPEFIFWLCSLVAGIVFVRFSVGICFSFIKDVSGVRR